MQIGKSCLLRQAGTIATAGVLLSLMQIGAGVAADVLSQASYHDELTALSLGSFTTAEQSARDQRYGVAEAEIVRIWPDNQDGVWLYQEQAFMGDSPDDVDPAMKDRPYFARVTHSVEVEPGVVRRSVHKLKDPAAAAGGWKAETPLSGLDPDDLEESECSITVTRIAENYWRSESEKCPNAYKGAGYALSLGITTSGGYANWDRGFTAEGAHVWGPATGGYIFKRKDDTYDD